MKPTIEKIAMYACSHPVFTIKELYRDMKIEQKYANTTRIILTRMCDDDILMRYEQGIYGYKKEGKFIKKHIAPTYEEMIEHVYLKDNNGYITGGGYLLSIGLSTWCPAKMEIASNQVKRTQVKEHVIIRKPKTMITRENKRYLQLLDCIDEIDTAPIDCESASKLLYEQIYKMDVMFLLYLAKHYYKKEVTERILDIIGEEYVITQKQRRI